MVGEKPWENRMVIAYGNVQFRDGLFRMWYKTWPDTVSPRRTYIFYAESDDGISWRKPVLGLVEFDGNKDNNIIMTAPRKGVYR